MEFSSVQASLSKTRPGRGGYLKFTDEARFEIGKYAALHGPMSAVKKFKHAYPKLKESTVRTFRDKYVLSLKSSNSVVSTKKITSLKRGRPLMLGQLDEKVKKFLIALRHKGGVVNTVVANATAKALIEKSDDEHLKLIDLEQTFWAKSLFSRMGFVKRAATTSRPDVPAGARREAELIFHHEIVEKVEKHKIPPSLILNIDQTPSKFAPTSSRTLAAKSSKHVSITGSSYKQAITATFGISFSKVFLPMQLIYGGKTAQSFPRFNFPNSFSLSANPKHFSNTQESLKLLDEVIIPYINSERENLGVENDQETLLIMDVFSGQMTDPVKEKLRQNNILLVRVPANMTNLFQPLDLTVNGSFKAFMKQKFTEWYSKEIAKGLDNGVQLEDIDVKLRLSVLKPLHAKWLLDAYNYLSTEAGQKIIENGWKAAGITEALSKGLSGLEPLDPFHSIDPLIQQSEIADNEVQNVSSEQLNYFVDERHDDKSDDDWEVEDTGETVRNIFEIFEDESEDD